MSVFDSFHLRPYNEVEDKRVVLLQSGGLDSLVLTAMFSRFGYEIQHLFIDYGFPSNQRDRNNVKAIIREYGGEFNTAYIDMPWLELNSADNMEYVNMRNSILLGFAWSLCEKLGYPYVASALIGIENSVNHKPTSGFDVHESFARKITEAFNEGSKTYHETGKRIELLTPFMGFYKDTVVQLGEILGVKFSLSNSCLSGSEKPCGKCEPCRIRMETFRDARIKDI